MAGFGNSEYILNKYVKILIKNNWTVVVWDQDTNTSKCNRSLREIFSPGTYFFDDNENDKINNNTSCLWIDIFDKNKIILGISNLNIYSEKSNI